VGGRSNTFVRLDGRGVSHTHATIAPFSANLDCNFRPAQTEDQQYDTLVESLRDPFLNESKHLKKEIAGTFVPAANSVKAAYQTLDRDVDPAYGRGVIQFNKACTEIEATMFTENAEFRTAYQATKVISFRYIMRLPSPHDIFNEGED
jgi:hypothetical protein